jgi:hypothetical protein
MLGYQTFFAEEIFFLPTLCSVTAKIGLYEESDPNQGVVILSLSLDDSCLILREQRNQFLKYESDSVLIGIGI